MLGLWGSWTIWRGHVSKLPAISSETRVSTSVGLSSNPTGWAVHTSPEASLPERWLTSHASSSYTVCIYVCTRAHIRIYLYTRTCVCVCTYGMRITNSSCLLSGRAIFGLCITIVEIIIGVPYTLVQINGYLATQWPIQMCTEVNIMYVWF